MSLGYVAVQWNGFKRAYDAVIVGAIALYVVAFIGLGSLIWRGNHAISVEILLMRALGTCALILLHVVLCIGPLARLNPRFLPLLYNRRHLGVATFLVALLHGIIALGYYHGFGAVNPLVSLLQNDMDWRDRKSLPFQILGAGALTILFLMAATSHDFWLRNLSARIWKTLHMLVYPAYGLAIMHVALGALQAERSLLYPILLGAGVLTVIGLHEAAGWRERQRDRRQPSSEENHSQVAHARPTEGGMGSVLAAREGDSRAASTLPMPPTLSPSRTHTERWIDACAVNRIPEGRAHVLCIPGHERIAIFKHQGHISAVSNVCAHQGGPVGEGKVIDGCITCPWHGWQYRPADGQSPPPFAEKIPTYRVRISNGRVWINPEPLPSGTPVTPAAIEEHAHA